ncbi:MAG: hypothetical protein AAF702_17150 [Chloroflexota bacterium]
MNQSAPLHKISLRQIAHARAGDKGNISSIGLFVFEPEHYETVKIQITAKRLKDCFGGLFKGGIQRYEIDHLHALNFVMTRGLEGGVNSSLNLDAHGKSFSFLLLSLEVMPGGP